MLFPVSYLLFAVYLIWVLYLLCFDKDAGDHSDDTMIIDVSDE
jgi:hypothetical protein